MKKRIRLGTSYRGKCCKNGSHFAHGGGVCCPPQLVDQWDKPWLSFTVRDQWGIFKHHN